MLMHSDRLRAYKATINTSIGSIRLLRAATKKIVRLEALSCLRWALAATMHSCSLSVCSPRQVSMRLTADLRMYSSTKVREE